MGRNKLPPLFLFLPWIWLALSCNSDRVFEEYKGMEPLHWDISDTVAFQLDPTQTERVISTIGVRYNDSFEFHNLYVRYLLKDSLGKSLGDSLINIELFDSKTGKPLGKGFGNVFSIFDTLPLTLLHENQRLEVQFVQYMRKDQLEGIEAVGLKVHRD